MAFAKKMIEFPSDLVSFSTKLPSKRREKNCVTFLQGERQTVKLGFVFDKIPSKSKK